jgi:rhodanese-related sulfurtransferase
MSAIEIPAKEAFELLKNDQNSVLVDVRTAEEFNFVGFPNASEFNNRLVFLPWQIFPEMNENPKFASSLNESLKKLFGENAKKAKVIFICRSGGRSGQAAEYAIELGYDNCYNLISGFEGDVNAKGHRGESAGWKASDLPWRQK